MAGARVHGAGSCALELPAELRVAAASRGEAAAAGASDCFGGSVACRCACAAAHLGACAGRGWGFVADDMFHVQAGACDEEEGERTDERMLEHGDGAACPCDTAALLRNSPALHR